LYRMRIHIADHRSGRSAILSITSFFTVGNSVARMAGLERYTLVDIVCAENSDHPIISGDRRILFASPSYSVESALP
jgi:hypothetical protein